MNDRMFHVLVLGGMALVGCGGSTLAEPDAGSGDASPHGPEDAASKDVAFPFETNAALLDGSDSLDEGSPVDAGNLGRDVWFPNEAPPPPPPLPVDAQAGDAGASDANGFADAVVAEGGPCMPCEAPK